MEVLDFIKETIPQIEAYNATIPRKISVAVSQLERAKSVEELQQIGILIRDILIEFGQSIYDKNMLVNGSEVPSTTDAKRMIQYALDYYSVNHENLMDFVKTCYSYSNAIQHDANTKKESVIQALAMTTLCVVLINESISESGKYKNRPYYKCPIRTMPYTTNYKSNKNSGDVA